MKFSTTLVVTVTIATILNVGCLTLAVPLDNSEQQQQLEQRQIDATAKLAQIKMMVTKAASRTLKEFYGLKNEDASNVQGLVINTVDYARTRIDDLCAALPLDDEVEGSPIISELLEDAKKDLTILWRRAAADIMVIAGSNQDVYVPVEALLERFIDDVRDAIKF